MGWLFSLIYSTLNLRANRKIGKWKLTKKTVKVQSSLCTMNCKGLIKHNLGCKLHIINLNVQRTSYYIGNVAVCGHRYVPCKAVQTVTRNWRFYPLDESASSCSFFEQNICKVHKISTPPRKMRLTTKLEKCRFSTRIVNHFGLLLRWRLFQLTSQTTKDIHRLQPPINLLKIRSVRGQCNFCRRVVSSFALIAATIIKKTHKYESNVFSFQTAEATQTMKKTKTFWCSHDL